MQGQTPPFRLDGGGRGTSQPSQQEQVHLNPNFFPNQQQVHLNPNFFPNPNLFLLQQNPHLLAQLNPLFQNPNSFPQVQQQFPNINVPVPQNSVDCSFQAQRPNENNNAKFPQQHVKTQNEMVEEVDKAARSIWKDLLNSNRTVSAWKVSQAALLAVKAESWECLGFQMQQVPSLKSILVTEGKINAFIHCFAVARKITSLYDLEVAVCQCEGVKQFEELELGPLAQHPLAVHYFSLTSNVTEVYRIKTEDIISYLCEFVDTHKKKEIKVETFLDFICKKQSVSGWENLCVRVQDFRLYVNHIKQAKQSEDGVLVRCSEKIRTESAKRSKKRPSFPAQKNEMENAETENTQFCERHVRFLSSSSEDDDSKSNQYEENQDEKNARSNCNLSLPNGRSELVSSCPYPSITEEMRRMGLKSEVESASEDGVRVRCYEKIRMESPLFSAQKKEMDGHFNTISQHPKSFSSKKTQFCRRHIRFMSSCSEDDDSEANQCEENQEWLPNDRSLFPAQKKEMDDHFNTISQHLKSFSSKKTQFCGRHVRFVTSSSEEDDSEANQCEENQDEKNAHSSCNSLPNGRSELVSSCPYPSTTEEMRRLGLKSEVESTSKDSVLVQYYEKIRTDSAKRSKSFPSENTQFSGRHVRFMSSEDDDSEAKQFEENQDEKNARSSCNLSLPNGRSELFSSCPFPSATEEMRRLGLKSEVESTSYMPAGGVRCDRDNKHSRGKRRYENMCSSTTFPCKLPKKEKFDADVKLKGSGQSISGHSHSIQSLRTFINTWKDACRDNHADEVLERMLHFYTTKKKRKVKEMFTSYPFSGLLYTAVMKKNGSSLQETPFIPLSDGTYSSVGEGTILLHSEYVGKGINDECLLQTLPKLYANLRIVNPNLLVAACQLPRLMVKSTKLLNDIGLKTEVTHEDALSLLRLWRKSGSHFEASVPQMSNFYAYLWKEMTHSKKKIIEELHSGPFIFVPNTSSYSNEDVVPGSLMSPQEVYWHDSIGSVDLINSVNSDCVSTVASSHRIKMLRSFYPRLHDFFVNECEVNEGPPFSSYLQILLELSAVALPHQAAKKVYEVFLIWDDALRSGSMSSEDVEFLKESLLKKEYTVLPTRQDKWVSLHSSFGLVCCSDDDKLGREFEHLEGVNFLCFGESTPEDNQMLPGKVSVIMRRLGIPILSEIITREAIPYGPEDSSSISSLVNWVLPYAQGYILNANPVRYFQLEQFCYENLRHLKTLVVEKLFYRYKIKKCDISSKRRHQCKCLLQENIMYCCREWESISHSIFMELSCLLFDGTPQLHFANFLYMISNMAKSGATREQTELFILNDQKVPKLPAEESSWSLQSVSSSIEINDAPIASNSAKVEDLNSSVLKRKHAVSSNWPPVDWKTAPGFESIGAYGLKTSRSSSVQIQEGDAENIFERTGICLNDISSEFNIEVNPTAQGAVLVEAEVPGSQSKLPSNLVTSNSNVVLDPVDLVSPDGKDFGPSVGSEKDLVPLQQVLFTGRLGELVAFDYFLGKEGYRSVKWVNEANETGLPYDIVLEGDEDTAEYIEVKATRFGRKSWFNISMREWQFAIEKGEAFSIAHVVLADDNMARVTIYKNLARLCQLGNLKLLVVPKE